MEALEGVAIRDRALVLDDILIVADLHVGRGATSNVELPVGDGSDMVDRLDGLCHEFGPDSVVVAGDLLHSFSTVPSGVERTLTGIQNAADAVGADTIVTPGNHDTMLESIWDGETTAEYRIGDTVVCHGHVAPEAEADRYIIGHDHPTISIEGQRLPCFLGADSIYEDAHVLMLPSFNRLVPGVEINEMGTSDFLSPLVYDAAAFAPIVRDENAQETLTFPSLGEFRHRL
jgi:putative SbcD/Mre11-related phosphoesterase